MPVITFTDGRYLVDGRPLPRVSDILAVINKPGLNEWKQRVGADEAQRISRQATDLGTLVHAGCEAMGWRLREGVSPQAPIDEADERVRPFLEAYRRYLDQKVRRVLLVEERVYHAAHGYAGTLDCAVELVTGEPAVLDFKTGKTVDHVTTPLQLAAYTLAARDMGILNAVKRLVVHLPSNQPGRVFEYDFSDADTYDHRWYAALRLYRHHEEMKDGWRFGQKVEITA